MQEIQTDKTIRMFMDTETIQNNLTTRQIKIYQAIENWHAFLNDPILVYLSF